MALHLQHTGYGKHIPTAQTDEASRIRYECPFGHRLARGV